MNEQYPLLFVNNAAESIDYKTQGFGPQLTIPERDRQTHGDRLIATFQRVWQQAKSIREGRTAVSLPVKHGAYIEFKGSPGCDLVTKSLEDIRVGVKLLNIREQVGEDGVKQTYATVFVPAGKENFFINKIRKYIDEEDRRSGLPKNQSLVNSIEDLRLAILESFWTDPNSLIPDAENPEFCELWLKSIRGNENNVINDTKEICDFLSVEFFPNKILFFPERIVCLIKATRTQLLELIESCPHIAELRLARETAAFWVNEPNISQSEWATELLSRVIFEESNVNICVLDTGVNNGHPLLAPVLTDANCSAYDPTWGTEDHDGHGTLMGGVSTYGDLEGALQSNTSVVLAHRLSSVKILPPRGENRPDLYGAITQQAMSIAEIQAPGRDQIFCCAVTSSRIDHKGKATSWSAAVDSITSGQADGDRRLFIVSAGNIRRQEEWIDYPGSNLLCSIEDPAQSWNALTVGAFTEKVTISDPGFSGHTALAPNRGLSPYSTCSSLWDSKWPVKPEIVLEGGNLRRAPDGTLYENHPELSVLSTSNDSVNNLFDTICATSAATAKAAWMAAKIKTRYRDIWPETVKGLIIHSAEWPQSIIDQFGFDITQKKGVLDLMRVCGFGVPSLDKALFCDSSVLTLVAEEYIQPFKFGNDNRPVANDMHLYEMPWPKDELLSMGAIPVKLRVTLCYFIEPGPGEVGWKERYRYASHGLRFDVNNTNDTKSEFVKRINIASRAENEGSTGSSGSDRWVMGANNRVLGSIHSDIWEGNAADIATCNLIAVYPVLGWWRERKHLGNVEKQARYSLIVSLITPPQDINIYTPVETIVRTPITIRT
jgi:hypothetical protein